MSKIENDIASIGNSNTKKTPVASNEQFAVFCTKTTSPNTGRELVNYSVLDKTKNEFFAIKGNLFGKTLSPDEVLELAAGGILKVREVVVVDGKKKPITNEIGIGTPAQREYVKDGQTMLTKGKHAPVLVATARINQDHEVFGYKIRFDGESGAEKPTAVSYILEGRVGDRESKTFAPLTLRNLMDLHDAGKDVDVLINADGDTARIEGFSTDGRGAIRAYVAITPAVATAEEDAVADADEGSSISC
jgi:hypothetical protein